MWFRILTLLVSFNNKENRLGDNNNNNIIKNTVAAASAKYDNRGDYGCFSNESLSLTNLPSSITA
jgi:hypothetical protein